MVVNLALIRMVTESLGVEGRECMQLMLCNQFTPYNYVQRCCIADCLLDGFCGLLVVAGWL